MRNLNIGQWLIPDLRTHILIEYFRNFFNDPFSINSGLLVELYDDFLADLFLDDFLSCISLDDYLGCILLDDCILNKG